MCLYLAEGELRQAAAAAAAAGGSGSGHRFASGLFQLPAGPTAEEADEGAAKMRREGEGEGEKGEERKEGEETTGAKEKEDDDAAAGRDAESVGGGTVDDGCDSAGRTHSGGADAASSTTGVSERGASTMTQQQQQQSGAGSGTIVDSLFSPIHQNISSAAWEVSNLLTERLRLSAETLREMRVMPTSEVEALLSAR
eukprot:GHVU01067160.1.p1 GENE.GHVU01067160.1~~GHVU01067160.1.p1  ORF type:complete len:197 (+),score=55.68 GHVU01067160.1:351-941(+)